MAYNIIRGGGGTGLLIKSVFDSLIHKSGDILTQIKLL